MEKQFLENARQARRALLAAIEAVGRGREEFEAILPDRINPADWPRLKALIETKSRELFQQPISILRQAEAEIIERNRSNTTGD